MLKCLSGGFQGHFYELDWCIYQLCSGTTQERMARGERKSTMKAKGERRFLLCLQLSVCFLFLPSSCILSCPRVQVSILTIWLICSSLWHIQGHGCRQSGRTWSIQSSAEGPVGVQVPPSSAGHQAIIGKAQEGTQPEIQESHNSVVVPRFMPVHSVS